MSDEYNIRFYMYDYNILCFRLLGCHTVDGKRWEAEKEEGRNGLCWHDIC
ncbi:MAG: hypothetical protein ACLTSL_17040 [Odoribacter splanchnicus]